jgi:hypothetical protein
VVSPLEFGQEELSLIAGICCSLRPLDILMHPSRIKVPNFDHGGNTSIVKRAQFALLLCGMVGVAMKLIFSSGTMAHPNGHGSNPQELSGSVQTGSQSVISPDDVQASRSVGSEPSVTRQRSSRTNNPN